MRCWNSMHELSICQAIVAQVERIAAQHAATTVASITLRIGPLSGVEAMQLEHAYPLAVAGTVLDRARLVIDSVPVRVRCRTCLEESAATPNRLVCAHCGEWRTDIVSGDELLLASVELDHAEALSAILQ
jgi:hydrogenase nickel incorporation protein HypA/HybF